MRFLFFVLLFLANFCFARVDDYFAETEKIKVLINQSIAEYEKGDNIAAEKLVGTAYFQHYENMEGPAARTVGRRAYLVERKFTTLRKHYKQKAEIRRIKAMIDGLFFDLDEITPIIQAAPQVKAERSVTDYDVKAAEEASVKANAARAAAADDIFASLLGDKQESKEENLSENLSEKSTEPAQIPQESNTSAQNLENENGVVPSADAEVAALQAASALNPKLQTLFDNFSLKLDEAAMYFKSDKEASKKLINSALFDDYRNSKVEIGINRYTEKGLDQKIQQGLRRIISRISDENITEHDMRMEFEEIKEKFFGGLLKIPEDFIPKVRVADFVEESEVSDYTKVADEIALGLEKLLSSYGDVSKSASIDELQSIYLDTFEASGMENKVGAVDTSLKLKIESLFTKGVALINSGASKDELKECFDELNALVSSAAEKTTQTTPLLLFISAFGILLREGLEALIIVVAIVSFLIQSGNQKRLNIVYSAIFAGVFLSFVTAFVIYYLFTSFAGQFRELMEGITFLIAVALLLYVAFWMLHKASDMAWAGKLKSQAVNAISSGETKALWISVFLAVFREGAETVLFYQAMLFDAKTSSEFGGIFAGLFVGIIVLIVLYFLLKSGAVKIPVKQFFKFTSYIIFFLCLVFTGKGIAELIEGKVIAPTFLATKFKEIPDLGLYPYYETIVPQIVVLIIIVIGILITKKLQLKEKK